MKRLHLSVLGSFQVTLDGGAVTEFRSDKVRALLAYVAVEAGIPHRRDALAGLLWPDVPDTTARNNLRLSLHRLRHTLHDLDGDSTYFEITRETIQFKPATAQVDAAVFADSVAASQRHDHRCLTACRTCVEWLTEAASLYDGDFLEGFFVDDSLPFAEWVLLNREKFHRHALWVLYHLTDHHRQRGELEPAETYAHRQLELDPWREEAHRQLMDILARQGETCAALAQYETCRRTLAAELDIEPDTETERLYARIQMMRTGRHRTLPPQATPFVGREAELTRIAELLADPNCRLLTLVGLGGIGKTRLAIQAALAVRRDAGLFLHGVAFVPLAGLDGAESLISAIADALDVSFHRATEPRQQIIDFLQPREMLLVLDNFEQVLDGTDFLLTLLERAPHVKLLVTSRERLNVHWEWLLPLKGLSFPPAESPTTHGEGSEAYDAVRLFCTCARRVCPSFELNGETETAVVALCQAVEGLPLAVELAAAWVDTLPVTHIVTQITRNLDLSATAARSLPARHRSLRAVFDHAWCRLSPAEQEVLAQCAVFRGGFTRQAALAVNSNQLSVNSERSTMSSDETDYCSLFADHRLLSLVDKSLLQLGPGGRYEMHELLRQYAAEKLAAMPDGQAAVHERHCAYYAAFSQRHGAQLARADAATALAAIKAEIANVRTAWRWAVTHGMLDEVARCLSGLSLFYLLAGPFQEGATLIEMAVDHLRTLAERESWPGQTERGVLSALRVEQARLLNRQGKYDQAITAARPAADWAGTGHVTYAQAAGRLQWGIALGRQGEYEAARAQLERAITLARATDCRGNSGSERRSGEAESESIEHLRQTEADAWRNLGIVAMDQGLYSEAQRCYEQALRIYHQIDDQRGACGTLNNLGAVCYGRGDYARARSYCEQALDIFRRLGDRGDESTTLSNLGLLCIEHGDYGAAEAYLEQALCVCREIGHRKDEGIALVNRGLLYHRMGDHARARPDYERALRIYRELGDRRSESLALACLCLLAHHAGDDGVACKYGRPAVQMAREVGDPNVLGYALTRWGHALVALERLSEGADAYCEALALRRALGQSYLALETLAGLARVALAQQDHAQAGDHVGKILSHCETETAFDGTDEPFRIRLTCYRVLVTEEPARAEAILRDAHRLLLERASNIDDGARRRSFLENVPAHRDIMALYRYAGSQD